MRLRVILRALHVEVAQPAELAVDITFLHNLTPLRHASALDLIQLTRVHITLGLEQNRLLRLEILVEELLEVHVVLVIELGRTDVMSLVPLEV